jgi:hypothetical protein
VFSKQLGTRQRAGICITEETNAIAIIVSEETGGISLAVAGTIERDLTVERLRERMGKLLRRYVPPTPLPTAIASGRGIDESETEMPMGEMPIGSPDSHAKPGSDR